MLSKNIQNAVKNGSAIRKMFLEGKEIAAKVGAENVYDFSLGNPVAPVPEAFTNALQTLLKDQNSMELHGYMNNAGFPEVRSAVAQNLNKRFGSGFTEEHIIMTVGAAGALNIAFKTLLDADDEVIVFAPYFSEYKHYVQNFGGKIVEVEPVLPSFAPNLEDLKAKITPKTKAVIINNPVNPTGVVYSEKTISELTDILKLKQIEYSHAIYLVADEPYRELVYDGAVFHFLPNFYDNTIVAYSFSKSLSVPGERIGYIAVSPKIEECGLTISALSTANRICGFVNAPSLLQKAVVACLDIPVELEFYAKNRNRLYTELTRLGFDCVKPEGAFYLFLKSPEQDEKMFIERAKAYNILLVAGTNFGCSGYVRLAYCVQPKTIEGALKGFESLAGFYKLA